MMADHSAARDHFPATCAPSYHGHPLQHLVSRAMTRCIQLQNDAKMRITMHPPDKGSLHMGEEGQSMATRRDTTRAMAG
ncbi:MAG: hypothetical protein WBN37_12105 [Arenicellales bacterium]